MTREAFGIDIGGTGVKGAVVDLATGKLVGERLKLATPHPATPKAVAEVVGQVVNHFHWTGPVGATFPGVVKAGVVKTAANVDKKWIDTDAAKLFSAKIGGEVTVVNDADAAGLAEAKWGAASKHRGVTLLLTLGTGIGSALLLDGTLVPNTELGHLSVRGKEAEKRASELVRERKKLSFKKWSQRLSEVLETYEMLLWPDLFVLGGGVSREHEKFIPLLTCRTPVVPADLLNDAGILGAALYDEETRLAGTPAPTRRGADLPPRRSTPPRRTASPTTTTSGGTTAGAPPTTSAPSKTPVPSGGPGPAPSGGLPTPAASAPTRAPVEAPVSAPHKRAPRKAAAGTPVAGQAPTPE